MNEQSSPESSSKVAQQELETPKGFYTTPAVIRGWIYTFSVMAGAAITCIPIINGAPTTVSVGTGVVVVLLIIAAVVFAKRRWP